MESGVHKERVAAMVGYLKKEAVRVTHAADASSLPDPYKIGRHEPDALGNKDGVTWIGEAKTGADLDETTSQEQFADFSNRVTKESQKPCPFILCVPKGYEDNARQAVVDAGGSTKNLTVIT